MSDCYGKMCASGNYKGDLEAIVKVMNQWWWSGCDLKFEVVGTTIDVRSDLGWVFYYPTAHPQIDHEDHTVSVTLETISRRMSPFLASGTLRLATTSRQKGDSWVETTEISADGKVVQTSQKFTVKDIGKVLIWVYDPSAAIKEQNGVDADEISNLVAA